MRASVPANLLLLGEYAVLEEGGLGLAVAVQPRLRVRAQPAPAGSGLTVSARMDGELRWRRGGPEGDARTALIRAAVQACCPPEGGEVSGTVEVDSSDLFPGGRKAGYGSSAAAAVGLCWALLGLGAGRAPPPPEVLRGALAAHRLAQGGRGSGYDVLASLHGGVGLFVGGRQPAWRPLRLPWLEPLWLFAGPRSVSTRQAIERYREWRGRRPEEARRFLEESNRDVQAFVRAASRREALRWFRSCRERGLRLGEAIGVAAVMRPPPGLQAGDCKALGAGDELGLAWPEPPGRPEGLRRVELAAEGLAAEEPACGG